VRTGKQIEVRKVKLGPLKSYFEGFDFLAGQYWSFVGICFAALMLAGLVPLVLIGPAYAGISICFLNHARQRTVKFEDIFKGFDYFMPSFIASLFYVGSTLIAFVPFIFCFIGGFVMLGAPEQNLIVPGFLLIGIGIVYWFIIISFILIVFMFAILLVVDKGVDGTKAFQLAVKGVGKNFWGVLGCAVVGQVVYVIAAMFCFFPAILYLPIMMAGHFVAYWKIFGIETDEAVVAQAVGPGDGFDASHGRQIY